MTAKDVYQLLSVFSMCVFMGSFLFTAYLYYIVGVPEGNEETPPAATEPEIGPLNSALEKEAQIRAGQSAQKETNYEVLVWEIFFRLLQLLTLVSLISAIGSALMVSTF